MSCHSHCNQCALHPGYIGPVTPTSWTNDPVDTGIRVKDDHFNELRSAIQDELDRRSLAEQTTYPDPGAVNTDDTIYYQHYRYVRNQIIKASGYTWDPDSVDSTVLNAGEHILAESTNDMRDETNVLEAVCICNCNYSCTCNCNYCTCQCNYACTCQCNYSDERLKRDIIYL